MKNFKKLSLVAGFAALMSFGAEAQYLKIDGGPSEGGQLIIKDANETFMGDNKAWNIDNQFGNLRFYRTETPVLANNYIDFNSKIRFTHLGQLIINKVGFGSHLTQNLDVNFTFNNKGKSLFEDEVQIGAFTTNIPSDVKLAVNGRIYTTGIKVSLPIINAWPDYVFKKDYKLRSLEEVENYITANNHLPDVPSEAAVTTDGIDLGNMDAVLLRKVEELTLYMIQLQKDNMTMKAQLEALSK